MLTNLMGEGFGTVVAYILIGLGVLFCVYVVFRGGKD